MDRLVGFQDLGTKDDFTTNKLENVLVKKGMKNLAPTFLLQLQSVRELLLKKCKCLIGMLSKKKKEEDDEDAEYQESIRRSVRSSENLDSDSD